MIKTETITANQKSQLLKFRKGISSLLVTRWIYLFFALLSSIGTIFLTLFLGSFTDWIFPSQNNRFSAFSNGIFAFIFLVVSIPRLIGNIMYIYQLKKTAEAFNDANFYKAYQKQRFRVFCYIFIII